MRDPDRISKVLKEVEKIWRLHPDWRLGQLLCNLAGWEDPKQNIVWDIEDDAVVAQIRRHLRQQQQLAQTDVAE